MNLTVFIIVECFTILVNLCFILDVWKRSKLSNFLRWIQVGLIIVNILNCLVSLAVDITLTKGNHLQWPLCFAIFINSPFCTHATLMLIIVINMEKIVAIKKPQLHRIHFKKGRGRLVVACTLSFAVFQTSMGIPDILNSYARSNSSQCLVSEFFSMSYLPILTSLLDGVLVVVLTASAASFIAILARYSKQTRNLAADTTVSAARKRKALVMSRITLASSFFYALTVGYRAFFTMWVKATSCDINCVEMETLGIICELAFLTMPIQDPLIYFVRVTKWSSLSKFCIGVIRIIPRRNQVSAQLDRTSQLNDTSTV